MTGGKGVRGLTVVMAYEMLEKPDKLTEESMKLARTLGWCYEMVSFDLGKVREIAANSGDKDILLYVA